MKFAYQSDTGRFRSINQDRCCVLNNAYGQLLGVICDGMGGHLAGEKAAEMAMDILCQSFMNHDVFYSDTTASQWLIETVEQANREIYEDATTHSEHAGMGTTLVAVLCLKHTFMICHVGDSRAYWFENKRLHQLTNDHTYVNLLVESGSINKEQAKSHPKKNVLMKAVGVFADLVVPHQLYHELGGMLCLCSDGLYNFVSDEQMIAILSENISLDEKVAHLIALANLNGGKDNISVVLIDGIGGESDES